jgi:hypothetical protein
MGRVVEIHRPVALVDIGTYLEAGYMVLPTRMGASVTASGRVMERAGPDSIMTTVINANRLFPKSLRLVISISSRPTVECSTIVIVAIPLS